MTDAEESCLILLHVRIITLDRSIGLGGWGIFGINQTLLFGRLFSFRRSFAVMSRCLRADWKLRRVCREMISFVLFFAHLNVIVDFSFDSLSVGYR